MILSNPFIREIDHLGKDYSAAIEKVLRSGWYILGKEVAEFENELASFLDVPHVVTCANGLDAIRLVLMALGIGPGDEVITTPLSAAATALAITHVGATPVFADVCPETLNLDPKEVEKVITSRTRAVMPVHLYGHTADMNAFRELCEKNGIHLIEDCAQSLGSSIEGRKSGSFGVAGCFSFYPTKNLGAFGDGGAVCTTNTAFAEKVAQLRNYGQKARYQHELLGINSRLDELQAAVLRVKLKHLSDWNEKRRNLAKLYDDTVNTIQGLWHLPKQLGAVYHLYPIQVDRRDEVLAKLRENGVDGQIHYPTLISEQHCYSGLFDHSGSEQTFPIAFRATRRLISLPIFPYLTAAEVNQVGKVLKDCLE